MTVWRMLIFIFTCIPFSILFGLIALFDPKTAEWYLVSYHEWITNANTKNLSETSKD